MKRNVLFVLTLFFAVGLMAEAIPEGFYNGINGKKDAELKTTLSELVRCGDRYDRTDDASVMGKDTER